MIEAFASSLEHVLAELERVDLSLRLEVRKARQTRKTDDRFAGLYISEEEVDEICSEPAGLPRWASATREPDDETSRAFEEIARRIEARKSMREEGSAVLRLDRLAELFDLDPFDIDVVLIGLAPEIDLRYERLFAYLQDDVQKRRPSVDLLLNLLCPSLPAKLEARARFAPDARLLRHRLVEIFEDGSRPHAPLLGKYIRVDPRVVGYLLDGDEVDSTIAHHVHCSSSPKHILAPPDGNLASRHSGVSTHPIHGSPLVHVQGPRGVGKRAWAEDDAARAGLMLLVVEGDELLADREIPFAACAQRVAREAHLRGAAIYWSGFDTLLTDEHRAHRKALLSAVAQYEIRTYLSGTVPWDGSTGAEPVRMARVTLHAPSGVERMRAWQNALGDAAPQEVVAELPLLAAKFRLMTEDIIAVALDAGDRSALSDRPLEAADLYAACRSRSARKLGDLAKKIEPHYTWNDLVLPSDALQQLQEICSHVKLRDRVFEEWGFDQKLSLGKGLHALFAGPSGTGKTMAAEIIAHDLGLDLYKIDLAGIVSKYIGETEKNLARIFAEAEATSAILFFDEADALFGKRSEVSDAHDRYANVETSFLLQRMEEYEGITILATNLRRNMDDAFLRRLAFAVQFPFPEEAERLRIWRGVFPSATPQSRDVDLDFMARQFKLSGGNIKNVALAAAFLAASDGVDVSMVHIVRATRRELQKMGRSHVNAEFGAYSTMLDG